MPQLMPFYWMNSVFMVMNILICLLILFFYKKTELMNKLSCINMNKNEKLNFMFLW